MTDMELEIRHNKSKCLECMYHSYVTNISKDAPLQTKLNACMCNYASITNQTCLAKENHAIVDRRGSDPENCQLFRKGDNIRRKKPALPQPITTDLY